MDYRVGLRQVNHELKKEIEQSYWDLWKELYPNMNQENFISFEEFKKIHKPQEKLNESEKAKIDRMVEDIRGKVVRN